MTSTSSANNGANHWERFPLGEICQGNGQYGTSERSTTEQKGLPVLRMGNLFEGRILWDDLKYADLPKTERDKYRLEIGDLIFNRTNSAELVGKSAVFDGSQEAIFASYLVRFRLRPDKADPHFVCAFLNSQFGRAFIEANMTRAIGQVNISASKMATMLVPVPPLAEQRRIAGRLREQLAEVAKARTAVQAQLAAAQALPAALLSDVFNSSQANRWPRMTLTEFTVEMRYGTSNQSTKHGYPVLRIPNVIGGSLDLSDLKYVIVEDRELDKLRLLDGDILFVRTNGNPHNVGRSAVFASPAITRHGIAPTNVIFASYLIRARFDRDRIEPRFVEYYLQSAGGRSDLLSRCKTSAGQYNISTSGLASLSVPVPPLDEQRAVAARLASELAEATQLQTALSEKLAAINRLPAALLAQAFQGGTDAELANAD